MRPGEGGCDRRVDLTAPQSDVRDDHRTRLALARTDPSAFRYIRTLRQSVRQTGMAYEFGRSCSNAPRRKCDRVRARCTRSDRQLRHLANPCAQALAVTQLPPGSITATASGHDNPILAIASHWRRWHPIDAAADVNPGRTASVTGLVSRGCGSSQQDHTPGAERAPASRRDISAGWEHLTLTATIKSRQRRRSDGARMQLQGFGTASPAA